MGMMRRCPCGVSPKSAAAASVTSAWNSGRSSSILEEPEKLAVGARRLAFLRLLARVPHEGAKRLQVCARMQPGERRQGFVIGEQPLAQGFEAPVRGRGLRRAALDGGKAFTDRFCVHV